MDTILGDIDVHIPWAEHVLDKMSICACQVFETGWPVVVYICNEWPSVNWKFNLYRSLVKERPPPTFGPISCIGSKFTQMSAHPGVSFAWSLRSTASSALRISGKKLRVILHWINTRHCELHYAHCHIMPFRVLCAVTAQLWSCWWFRCTGQLFALRASSHCKHDVGALSWWNTETVERVPTPLFGRL